MLKKIILSTFLMSMLGGCFVHSRRPPPPSGQGHRCGVGTTWNGNHCKRTKDNRIIVRDNR